MSAPRRRICAAIVLLAMFGGSAGSVWHLRAQNRPASRSASIAPPPAVTNGERGATYDWLEDKATNVTTRFADAVAIGTRGPDGRIVTRLTDLAGNDIATLRIHRAGIDEDTLDFTLPDGTATRAARRKGVRATLDWNNLQAYSLWKDRAALGRTSLEWQDTLVRPKQAKPRDLDGEMIQTDTAWVGGFSATVTRKHATHVQDKTGRKVSGPVLVSVFRQDGVEVGWSHWWPQEQMFEWSFPGLTEGAVDAATLKDNGGWTFTPDMAWLNTQNLAFHQFHTLVKTQGSVSERRAGWLERLGALLSPRLSANEPGCDGLHWLDSSVFRPCCDQHDRCYAKSEPACTFYSWWSWYSSWTCTVCNSFAALCFATGGHVFQRLP